jgi:hypothetical protein
LTKALVFAYPRGTRIAQTERKIPGAFLLQGLSFAALLSAAIALGI